jgi:N-acetylneuraminic acid mutarotase
VNGDATTPSWYYAKTGAVDGQQVGPVSWEQLVSLVQTGALVATDLVWNPQFPSWVTVSEVPGLTAPPLLRMRDTSQEMGRPPLGQTGVRPGAVQPTAARPGAIQPAPRQAARPSSAYDPFLDEGEPADFGGQRPWLRWGMIIGAVVVIVIIVGVYFGVIRGGGTSSTTTLAPTSTVLETTTSDTEVAAPQAVWADLAPTGTLPKARSEHAVAYDTGSNAMVLFGGWDKSSVAFNDTWTFDPNLNAWTAVTTTGKLPAARAQHQMVYDPNTSTVIMFGGISKPKGTQYSDTWAYDPTAKTWTDKKPAGTVPSARSSFSMVLNDNDQKIYLFGGWSKAADVDHNDLWSYDSAANTWTAVKPTGDLPGARSGCALAYDQVENKLVLFGGVDSKASTYLNDTWVFDFATNAWTKVTPVADSPSLRAGARMAYDPVSGNMLLFGGWDGASYFNDTWTYTVGNMTWTKLDLADAPSARISSSLVYSAISNNLILFGGLVGADVAQDTWSYGVSEDSSTTDDTLPSDTEDTAVIEGTTTTLAP